MTLSIEQKAAALICTGVSEEPDGEELERLRAFAGVIFFDRNGRSPRALAPASAALCARRETPALIAIDQEGGRVSRLREGVEPIPSMMALCATADEELARRAGAQTAFDLRRAGVNVNFAPVLDLAVDASNTVIGNRGFSDNPREVVRFAGAFCAGLRSGGIVPVYKHFPGHGSTQVDSHLELPVVELDERTLRDRDLAPYSALLAQAPAVMTAHVLVRALDPQRAATISPVILTKLLRNELGFRGVCFTDCLEMGAIAGESGSVEGALLALRAGADCLLLSHSIELAQDAATRIARAVTSGELDAAIVERAYARLEHLRAALQPPLPLDAAPPHAGIATEIAGRAITLLRGDPRVARASSAYVVFGCLPETPGTLRIALPEEPSSSDTEKLIDELHARKRRPVILMRRVHTSATRLDAVRRIVDAHPDAVVVSLLEPFDALALTQARHVLCTYDDGAVSIGALERVLFEGRPARGRLPLENARP